MTATNLENEVHQLNKQIEIYKMAIEHLMVQKAQHRLQVEQYEIDKQNWQSLEKQYTEVNSRLANQLRNMDNNNTKMSEVNKKLHSSLVSQLKINKSLKQNTRHLKRLKRHVRETNSILDDVICNGDCILSEIEQ